MGYTTNFAGAVQLSRPLTFAEAKELLEFAHDSDKITEPHPDSHLQWVPTVDLRGIVWDGNEKFYEYGPWMEWVCGWLEERGIAANGRLRWSGEEVGDTGWLTVAANQVSEEPDTAPEATASPVPLTLRRLAEMALEQMTGDGR